MPITTRRIPRGPISLSAGLVVVGVEDEFMVNDPKSDLLLTSDGTRLMFLLN